MAPGATAIIGTTIETIRHISPLRNATAIARAMMANRTISDHRGTTLGIYFGNMNDKIKQLLATAEKVDGISKIKWRIENRELLRKQRKIELKILMNNDKRTSVECFSNQAYELFEQYSEGKFDRTTLNKLMIEATTKYILMEKERLEEAYQDGKEIGTIETLLKNKNL